MFAFEECPKAQQTRFEDNCYEYASNSIPRDIITNIDACKALGSDLWVPETSAEHTFIAQGFPGADENDNLYHLGILKYDQTQGFYGVDNSFHVGNTYFSLSDELNSQVLDKLASDEDDPCLVYNPVSNNWKLKNPCVNALGVCKSRLGKKFKYIFLVNSTSLFNM